MRTPASQSGRPQFASIWRYAWASPTSAIGLVVAGLALALGARARLVRGVLEVTGPPGRSRRTGLLAHLARRSRFDAITLGHVVLAWDGQRMARWRAHERVHVRQCERWGPLFLPAYLLAGALAWCRGGSAYRDNAFEREAFTAQRDTPAHEQARPPRPPGPGL